MELHPQVIQTLEELGSDHFACPAKLYPLGDVYSLRISAEADDGPWICVVHVVNESMAIREATDAMDSDNPPDRVIAVATKNAVHKMRGAGITVFREEELMYNATRHSDFQPHRKVPPADCADLLAYLKIDNRSLLPAMTTADVAARYYGFACDDIIQTTRQTNSGTMDVIVISSDDEADDRVEIKAASLGPIAAPPALWTRGDAGDYPITAPAYGNEYAFVADRWEAGGLKRAAVTSIHRIQNISLYNAYMAERSRLSAGAEDEQVAANEDCLFHVAHTDMTQIIMRAGFQMKLAAPIGPMGTGIYFANRSSYSLAYSDAMKTASRPHIPGVVIPLNNRVMILARVALGRVGHDSAAAGDVCCVFKGDAAYPEWIVVFDATKV